MTLCKLGRVILLLFVSSNAFAIEYEVPWPTDSSNQAAWWFPIVSRSEQLPATDGLYFAFNSPGTAGSATCDTASTHKVTVAKMIGGLSGTPVKANIKNADGTEWLIHDDCGHYAPTMAIDGSGRIHLWSDMRSVEWRYFRSPNSPAFDITNVRRKADFDSLLVPPSGVPLRTTYPIAKTAPNGDIYLMVNWQKTANARALALLRWNNSTSAWSVINPDVASVDGRGIYPDDMQIDALGPLGQPRVHMIFAWSMGGSDQIRHYGSYIRYDVATNTFATVNTSPVTTPVSYATTPGLLYQGLQAGEPFVNCQDIPTDPVKNCNVIAGIQVAKLALTPAGGVPSIAYRMRVPGQPEFGVWRTFRSSSAWVTPVKVSGLNLAGQAQSTIPTLGHTHDGTNVRVYYATNEAGNTPYQGLFVVENTNSWNPVQLLIGKPVTRIAVVPRGPNYLTDYVYAQNPTGYDAHRGRLYLVED